MGINRSRYTRRSRRLLQQIQSESNTQASSETGVSLTAHGTPFDTPSHGNATPDPAASLNQLNQEPQGQDRQDDLPPTSSPSSPAPTPGTRFFGESNFLTLVPGEDEGTSTQSNVSGGNGNNSQKPRFTFPMPATPQSTSQAAEVGAGLSAGMMRYLHDEGALTLPDLHSCLPAFEAYFAWFHPSYPVLDRAQVARRMASASSFSSVDMSRMLLQAMLMIGATYCDASTIRAMGFEDRSQAKTAFYTRARLLFHADWEKDETVLIQSLFLMSFWRGAPSGVRDVRYWLGVVITLAESYGLHRSYVFFSFQLLSLFELMIISYKVSIHAKGLAYRLHETKNMVVHLRKTILILPIRKRGAFDSCLFVTQVRERQAAVALGLPSRIRDEDCDIEPLGPSDLESEVSCADSSFGSSQPEQVTYAIKMVEIAKLREATTILPFYSLLIPSLRKMMLVYLAKTEKNHHFSLQLVESSTSISFPDTPQCPRPPQTLFRISTPLSKPGWRASQKT